MVSAVSRVVARTEVNKAISSSTLPPAASNTPPVRLIAVIMSSDSTANFLETALIAPSLPSRSTADILNCLIIAMAPSAVFSILVKVGANSVFAKAFIA